MLQGDFPAFHWLETQR